MGNTRRFRAGRQGKVLSQKEQLRQLRAENAYLSGYAASVEAQLAAAKMERPADLEEWIDSVLPDLSDEERTEWDAMSPEEREAFKDALGQQINQAEALLASPSSTQ